MRLTNLPVIVVVIAAIVIVVGRVSRQTPVAVAGFILLALPTFLNLLDRGYSRMRQCEVVAARARPYRFGKSHG